MKITWFVMASLMTSCCVFSAPSGPQHDRTPFNRRETPKEQLKEIEEGELTAKLKYIVQKAQLELEKMELIAETIQDKTGNPDPRSLTPEELLLLKRNNEEGLGSRKRENIDISKLLLNEKHQQDNFPTLEQLLLLQKLMDRQNQDSDDTQEADEQLSGPREMTPEQKLLEEKFLERLVLSYEELIKLAELRSKRSGRSTLQELLLLQHHTSSDSDISKLFLHEKLPRESSPNLEKLLLLQKLMDRRNQESDDTEEADEQLSGSREMSPEQKNLEAQLLQNFVLSHAQLLRLAELRARRSGRSTLQELIILQRERPTRNIDLSKIFLDEKLPRQSSPNLEQLLLLQKLMERRNQESDDTQEADKQLSGPRAMSQEQKLLEEKLLQRIVLSYEELLKLAELRSKRSGRSTLQELLLLQRHTSGIDFSKLFLAGKLPRESSPSLDQFLLLQKLMGQQNQESDDTEDADEQLSGPREMSPEQKFLEEKLLERIVLSYEELLKLAELRSQRSGRSTLQELLLLQHHTSGIDFSKLFLAGKLPRESSPSLEQLLLLQNLMDRSNQDSDDTEEADEQLSGPRKMSQEQKLLEEKLLQRVLLSYEELMKLAELRSRRSGKSTLQELLLLQSRTSGIDFSKVLLAGKLPQESSPNLEQLLLLQKMMDQHNQDSDDTQEADEQLSGPREMSQEQKLLEEKLLQRIVLSYEELLKLAELRSRRSARSTLEELILLQRHRPTHDIDLSKLFLDGKLPRESSPNPEQLLLLQKLVERRNDNPDDTEETEEPSTQLSGPREMTPAQKFLEAQLLQKAILNYEQLLRLAELRSQISGRTTLEELTLLHKRNGGLTPEKILMFKTITSVQLAKYFFLQSDSSHGLLGSMIDKLSELAHAKAVLENSEVYLLNLLKNNQRRDHMSLSELYLINSYHESMSHSMARSRFLLEMYLTNMTSGMGVGQRATDQQRVFAATLLERMIQQRNSMWMKEEAMLMKRYRSGKASLAGTVLAYRELDAMMNSGVGSALRSYVMNMVRMNMMNGSGMAMMRNGTWMNGWMNNMEFMEASDNERSNELWDLFKLRYARTYTGRVEERRRRRNFEAKVSEIVQHNIEAKYDRAFYTMGLNHLSDWSEEELSGIKGYQTIAEQDEMAQKKDVEEGETAQVVMPNMPTYTNTVPVTSLPAAVNWTATPWVGPVQDQYQCGSCWTFSASGALEAQYYNKTKTFVTLSEQNLVDCTYYLGNLGCSGGNIAKAFDYVMTVGIDTYASYPYTGRANNGTCLYNPENSVTKDNGWMYIPEGDELALQQAVALVGPVSAAIDASQSSFDSYTTGVYSSANCSSTQLDHAILIVGYGTTSDGQDYWLIKNSWGVDWGMNGYMMMERNVNMCGIATAAVFPLIN